MTVEAAMTQQDDAAAPPALRDGADFYAGHGEDAALLRWARELEGIDWEVAKLRARLAKLEPEDQELFTRATSVLVKAVALQYRMSAARTKNLSETVASLMEQISFSMTDDAGGEAER
jgi:hypothetical protein